MPIHFENEIRLGKAGVYLTKANAPICVPLTNVSIPVLSGVVEVGETLTCSTGTWNGSAPITYPLYVWFDQFFNTLQSGSSNTYVIQSSDEGSELFCRVFPANPCTLSGSVYADSELTIPVPAPFDYLFDTFATYSVTPRAAYSFRKLNSAYTGACCRIRRDNDNAELDIGFVANVVDVASIQAFVPIGASGQIVYIYDQSGNGRHRYQSIANRQPDILDGSGNLVVQNGRYGTHLNNSSKMLQQLVSILASSGTFSAFNIYNENNTAENILFVGGVNQYGYVSQIGLGSSAFGAMSSNLNKVNNVTKLISTRDQSYKNLTNQGGLIAHYGNLSLSGFGGNWWFGGYDIVGGGYAWLGYYMEEVYCDGLQVSNSALSTAVYQNQATFFGLPIYDSDAINYFERVNTAGGILSVSEMNAVNQLVLDLKAAGLWTLIDAAYPMVGSSASAFAQNLKSSSYTGTFTSGWTYASTGATPNGTSAYMNSGYDQSLNGSLNDLHISYYSRTDLPGGGIIGSFVLTPSPSFTHMYARYPDNKAYLGLNSVESSVVNGSALGFYIGSRITNNVIKLYRNNTTIINATQNSVSLPLGFVPIGATRNGITGVFDYGKLECAFASIGKGMTDTQASNFYTAIQTFQTSLSRQV